MQHRNFSEGILYHVYNRGNRKHKIFFKDADLRRFVVTVKKYEALEGVVVCGYCLMPNHYHLLVKMIKGGSISFFMQKLGNSYTKYINARYGLVGHVFQGNYQVKAVVGLRNIDRVVEYVRENPVKDGLVSESRYYRWLEIRGDLL